MNEEKEASMWCHLLLLMPAIGLGLFVILPWQVAFPPYAIVSVTSLFIYYKIVKAMGQPVQSGREAILGAMATVVAPVDPAGQVRFQNELWSAVSDENLKLGQRVRVVGFQGMKLIVSTAEGMESQPAGRSHCQGSRGR
ncbi:MAG: hypothetical protein GTO63_19990 [Anaerolineae bacterium]|nr:hypothetical protein [Anaerolineae bacterium]NIN97061.1 hypothetical protein [Anaerolineae bacterium]NIQ80010.1 hypothetical protein [Anaerolineae bacterium]